MVELLVIVFYLAASILQVAGLQGQPLGRTLTLSSSAFALILHGFLLYQWIDGSPELTGASLQNLSSANLFSLICWVSAGLVCLVSLSKPVQSLMVMIYPVTCLSVLGVRFFPGSQLVDTGANPQQLIHVLSAILTVGVLWIAGMQALLFLAQDRCLRGRYGRLVFWLPPVETMENLLVQVILLGFLLLSLVLLSSFFFFGGVEIANHGHSTELVLLAWLIFALLLFGRHYFAWRGQTTIRWTLAGVVILLLSYFGQSMGHL